MCVKVRPPDLRGGPSKEYEYASKHPIYGYVSTPNMLDILFVLLVVHFGVCVCVCVGVWVCGCVGVWVCGCVGVWVWVWVCVTLHHYRAFCLSIYRHT